MKHVLLIALAACTLSNCITMGTAYQTAPTDPVDQEIFGYANAATFFARWLGVERQSANCADRCEALRYISRAATNYLDENINPLIKCLECPAHHARERVTVRKQGCPTETKNRTSQLAKAQNIAQQFAAIKAEADEMLGEMKRFDKTSSTAKQPAQNTNI